MKICIDCGQTTRRGARCPTCTKTLDHTKTRNRTSLTRHGGARHLRQTVNQNQGTHCAHCHHWHPHTNIQIDHIKPLATGGNDHHTNTQALCKPCHQQKTSADNQLTHAPEPPTPTRPDPSLPEKGPRRNQRHK